MPSLGEPWTAFALGVYTLACTHSIVWRTYTQGWLYLVKKLSFLTWETILLTLVYFTLKQCFSKLVHQHVRNKLYLVCLSLNCIVVLAYWSLYSINPKLVDTYDYTAWDFEWFLTLFSHGIDLCFLVIEGVMIKEEFHTPNMRWFLEVEVLFTTVYCSIQWVSRQITGQPVYGFLDKMNILQITGFYLLLGVISMGVKAVATLTLRPRKQKQH